jgi:ubiquinone/menaquinone biosynthesis C-methylase UbiE
VAAQEPVSHFYAPGHSARELDRLSVQARMYEPFTRQLFREAGLLPGMRVLDVGCGSGDVTLLAGELVGPTGAVVGIDEHLPQLFAPRRAPKASGCRTCNSSRVTQR